METGPKWYILRAGHRIGPLDASQLKYMASEDQLDRTDLVWKDGLAQWVQAGQVKGLFDAPAPAPVPPPPAHVATPIPSLPKQPTAAPTQPVQPALQPTPAPAPAVNKPVAPAPTPAAAPTVNRPTPAPAPTPTPVPVVNRPTPVPAPAPNPWPAPQPVRPSPLPALDSRRDSWTPIVAGIMILITIIMPWYIGPEYAYGPSKTKFSWNMLDNAFRVPGGTLVGVWIILTWVAGLAALILTPLTRGLARAGILTGLGLITGILLLIVAFESDFGAGGPRSGMSEGETAFGVIAAIAFLVIAIVMHLARRSGHNKATRITQIVFACVLGVSSLLLFIFLFAASNSIWSQYGQTLAYKSPWGTLLRLTAVLTHVGFIVASVLVIFDAVGGGQKTGRSTVALTVLYLVMVISVQADAFFEAQAKGAFGMVFLNNAMLLLTGGILLILGSGLVLLIDGLRRRGRATLPAGAAAAGLTVAGPAPVVAAPAPARPVAAVASPTVAPAPMAAATAAAPPSLEQKFAKLDELRRTGIISEQEYQQKRQQLLSEI